MNNYTGAIALSFVCLLIVLMQGLSCEGAALQSHLADQHVITKRNAWWSKKSTDDVNRVSAEEPNWLLVQKKTLGMRDSVDCYTDTCVAEFVWCGRQMQSKSDFLQCKLQHRLCASRCFRHRDEVANGLDIVR